MKKKVLAMLLGLLVGPVSAWEYDMNEVTCEDVANDERLAVMMIFWLDGYISAEQEDTTVSEEWLDELTSDLQEGCRKEPQRTLLGIVKKKVLED